jgi:hypothetical protein
MWVQLTTRERCSLYLQSGQLAQKPTGFTFGYGANFFIVLLVGRFET